MLGGSVFVWLFICLKQCLLTPFNVKFCWVINIFYYFHMFKNTIMFCFAKKKVISFTFLNIKLLDFVLFLKAFNVLKAWINLKHQTFYWICFLHNSFINLHKNSKEAEINYYANQIVFHKLKKDHIRAVISNRKLYIQRCDYKSFCHCDSNLQSYPK